MIVGAKENGYGFHCSFRVQVLSQGSLSPSLGSVRDRALSPSPQGKTQDPALHPSGVPPLRWNSSK
jgi:hypothetical protein